MRASLKNTRAMLTGALSNAAKALRDTRAAMSKSDLLCIACYFAVLLYFVACHVLGYREGDALLQAMLLTVVGFLSWVTWMFRFYCEKNAELARQNLALYESEVAKWKRVNSEIAEAIVECENFNQSARMGVARTCGRILHAMEEPDDD